jgi:hypothetical protein
VSARRRLDITWMARAAGIASLVAHHPVPAPYGPPQLLLAHPAPGASVPGDKAAVIFRYVAGEDTDPLDLRSFAVLVDGVDRTLHFRVTADAAWGPIVSASGRGVQAHEIRARLCSVRGVCAELRAIVTVVGGLSTKNEDVDKTRRARIIDIVLEAARRLLKP